MARHPRHDQPHFNDEGGCICTCGTCLVVRIDPPERPGGRYTLRQRCRCRDCNQECPTTGRIESVTIDDV